MTTTHEPFPLHLSNKRYILHEMLGKGGMGVVYRATDRLNGQEVALKQVYLRLEQLDHISLMPHSASRTTQNLRLALAQEFQTLASLHHPHIISVLDYGFGQDGQPYFTMTLLEEPQTIVEAAQDIDMAGKIGLISQTLQALAYLHRRGILHRDLKPSNVLVSEERVRVLDFGLSASKEEAESSSGGTFAYMAPELFLGEHSASEASDLYAVGVIAYELLVGHHPFEYDSKQFIAQVLNQAPDLSSLEAPIAEVVDILLRKTPQKRYESAEAALAAFSEIVGQSAPIESVAIRESYLQAATFVGRQKEMAQLQMALTESQKGHGSAWLIGGESGVGKSRLIDELRIQALVKGCLVLHGQAERDGGNLPYELWREPLRHLVVASAELDDLSAAVLMSLLPDIEQLLDRPISAAPILEAEATQQRLFATITRLLSRFDQPIVLILEDLQWSQEGLSVLPYLTRQIGQTPLLILGTYRDDEDPNLPSLLKEWQVMRLARLSEANIAELSRAILGEVGQKAELLTLLQRETEGNAFFLVEVMRALAEEVGRLGRIANMKLPESLMPQGIATIVQRRLARVPKAAYQLLELAAVAWRALDLTVIESLGKQMSSEASAIDIHNWWLPVCADAAVLELQHNRWQFTHDKLREGLLASLSPETLIAHHRQIAETIEHIYPDDPNQAEQLMYHWGKVGDSNKERDYAYLAGTYAASRYANTEAITYLSRAYDLTSTQDINQLYEILLAREKIYALLGQSEAQEAELNLLNQIVDAIGQPKQRAEVTLRQANMAIATSRFPTAIRHAQLAITEAQQAGERLLLVKAYRLWGESLSKQANYDTATKQFEQALMIAKSIEANASTSSAQRLEIAELLGHLGHVASRKSDFGKARSYFEESLTIHRAIENRQGEAQAYCSLGRVDFERSAYPEARSYLKRSLAIFQEIGDKQGESRALSILAMLHGEARDYVKAQKYFEGALVIEQSIGNKTGIGMKLNNLGVLGEHQRQYKKAYDYFAQSLVIFEEVGDKLGQAISLLNMGCTFRNQKGVYAQIKRDLEHSLILTREIEAKEQESTALMHLGALFNRLGDYSSAQLYLEGSLAISQAIGARRWEGRTLILLGKCLIDQNTYRQAKIYLDKALVINQEINYKAKVGQTLNNLAWLAYQLGDYEEMERDYLAALASFEGLNELHGIATAQAGVVWARVLQNKKQIEKDLALSLTYLDENPNLLIPESAFRLYLLCYWSLQAMNDYRAKRVLIKGHQRLQQLAQNIEDASWLRFFLEDVPEHREIVRLFESTNTDEQATSSEHQSQDASAERSLSDLLVEIISEVDAERGVIVLQQADGKERIIKSVEYGQDSISRTIINKVIQDKKSLLIRNAMTDRLVARARSIIKGRIRSVLCVPLLEEDKVIGAIYLEDRRKRGKFSPQDLSTVEQLGQQMMLTSSLFTIPKRNTIKQHNEHQATPEEGDLSEKPKSPNSRYILHEQLGQGGMGMVHRATDRLTGKMVALKQVRIPPEQLELMSGSHSMTKHNLHIALAQEFQLVAGLRHPHIISVLNYGFGAEQQPYFTMRYLPEAETILEAGMRRDQAGKIELIEEILQALAYLHRRGIIHRDLKPSNVLVADNSVRVLDFGLSISQEAKLTSAGGTLLYMAPELLNQDTATQASDLYAVGVMAYQLFAGQHPFDITSYAFVDQVLYDAPDLTMLGLDEPLANVIAQLLAKKPADRYLSAERCLRAIRTALGEAVPPQSAAIRESYLQAATFVGREKEIAQLQNALVEAKRGPGSVWLIGGESGVGKSRLIEEFRIHGLVSGWQVLTGQAVAEGGHPYQLWHHIIPSLLLNTELTDLEAGVLKQITPTIDRLLGRDIPAPPEVSGEAGQQRLILTIISILQRQPQPILLLLEDLQWAQRSLAPLKQMLRVIEQLPRVMVVGTYRNDEAPRLPEALPASHTLRLDRLSEAQIEKLSQAMLGEGGTSPHIVSLLTQETEGNTFFIVEVMLALAEEAGNLDEVGRMTLPHGVFTRGMHHLLKHRIQKVAEADQGLLQLAAVAGRQLDPLLLQQLKPEQNVTAWLHRITEACILTVREGQWLFAHDKLREVIRRDLTDARRRVCHRQVAEAIEQVYPDHTNYHRALLEHWHQANYDEKAMHYLLPVAQNLIEITADYEEALKWIEIGLQTRSKADSRRVSLWNLQAKVYFYQGNYGAVIRTSQQAEKLASQLNDQRGLAESLTNAGRSLDYQGDYDQASKKIRQSLTLYKEIDDKVGLAGNLNNLGVLATESGDDEEAIHYLQQSLSLYQEIGNQHGIALCFLSLANLALDRNHFEEAINYTEQSLIFLKGIGDQRNIANCLMKLGVCARYQKNYKQAIDYLQQALLQQKTIGNQTGTSTVLNNLGRVAYLQGNYQQAIGYAEQSFVIRKANGFKYGQVFSLLILGFASLKLQKVEARETFWQALSISHAIESSNLMQAAVAGFAWLYQKSGDLIYAAELTSLVKWNDAQLWLDGLHSLLEQSLGVAELQAAIEHGNTLNLDQVTQALLDEFLPEKQVN